MHRILGHQWDVCKHVNWLKTDETAKTEYGREKKY